MAGPGSPQAVLFIQKAIDIFAALLLIIICQDFEI